MMPTHCIISSGPSPSNGSPLPYLGNWGIPCFHESSHNPPLCLQGSKLPPLGISSLSVSTFQNSVVCNIQGIWLQEEQVLLAALSRTEIYWKDSE